MFTVRAHTSAGGVSITAPVFLVTISLLGLWSPVVLAEGHVEPAPETIKGWLEVFAYLAGLILLVVNLVKAFRPDPSNDRKFATKLECERVEREARERHEANEERIDDVEESFGAKHGENIGRFEMVTATINALVKDIGKEHESMRRDVRHDLREEVQPIQSMIDAHNADVGKQFQSLAGEIGGLKVAKEVSDRQAAEVRRTLDILLSRTAPTLRRGGGEE